jgi:hypothetical protein
MRRTKRKSPRLTSASQFEERGTLVSVGFFSEFTQDHANTPPYARAERLIPLATAAPAATVAAPAAPAPTPSRTCLIIRRRENRSPYRHAANSDSCDLPTRISSDPSLRRARPMLPVEYLRRAPRQERSQDSSASHRWSSGNRFHPLQRQQTTHSRPLAGSNAIFRPTLTGASSLSPRSPWQNRHFEPGLTLTPRVQLSPPLPWHLTFPGWRPAAPMPPARDHPRNNANPTSFSTVAAGSPELA